MQTKPVISDDIHYHDLKTTWDIFKQTHPHVDITDTATTLGVSEAELIATGCGDMTTRLKEKWPEIISQVTKLGKIKTICCNLHATHEQIGIYQTSCFIDNTGLIKQNNFDTRLCLNAWHSGFAVTEIVQGKQQHSLQFFDIHGHAIYKIYLTSKSRYDAYLKLVKAYTSADQSKQQITLPTPSSNSTEPNSQIEPDRVRTHWNMLQDIHRLPELFTLFNSSPTHCLRLAGNDLARPISPLLFSELMYALEGGSLPIAISVSNTATTQTHVGPIYNIKTLGPWLKVINDDFNFSIREDRIGSSWIVRIPNFYGYVDSLILYDNKDNNIAYLSCQQTTEQPEELAWHKLLASLPTLEHS